MKYLIFSYLLCFFCLNTFAQEQNITIKGRVINKDSEPLSFASLLIEELNHGLITNIDGEFSFKVIEGETYNISVSYVNCVNKRIAILAKENFYLKIVLEEQSYALDDVIVMAEYKTNRGSAATINQQALEHIQPVSIGDVFSLIPGGLFNDNSSIGHNRISLRQAGSDNNTCLGLSIVMDGVPMDNDGYRSQLKGLTSEDQFSNRLSLNKGFDLKSISTDHIQKIDIIRGISSAKYGNLSSGMIQTKSKIGKTPLQIKAKTDPLTKLFYAGKGFELPNRLGYLHAGADYTTIYEDRRDPLSKYSRLTGQLTYNNSFDLSGSSLFIFVKLSETYTINEAKEDELIKEYNESFKNKYSRTGLVLKAKLSDFSKIIDNIEFVTSADYTYDLLDRNKIVLLGIPQPSPLSMVEGESEGIFLPSTYYSNFQIENKPLSILNQINFESIFELLNFKNKIISGIESKYTKNYGLGVIADMTRPPYPGDNEYIRPVANNDIPALSVGSVYIEEQMLYQNKYFDLDFNLGLRAIKMFNLNSEYKELNKTLVEPRLNLAISFNSKLKNEKVLKNMIRLGYGQQNKLPTLDYIYPDKVYKDYSVLNAYIDYENPFNKILTYTQIYNSVNYGLKPNRNNKYEIGWDIEYEDYLLSLNLFKEKSDLGFKSTTNYNPVAYKRYKNTVDGQPIVGKRPEKSDYIEENYQRFANIPLIKNTSKVEKKGIEYRIKFPRIEAINTNIEINGAYYATKYSSVAPRQYHPSFRDNDKYQPYVGIYANDDSMKERIFNANTWVNVNIPKYKMIFSVFSQLILLNDIKKIKGDSYPSQYLDNDGNINDVSPEIINKIENKDIVWRHYNYYQEEYSEDEPVSLTVNLKATKEFSHQVKASFFVNNILNVNPKYKNHYNQNVRNWNKAFFGAEMILSF